MYSVFKNEVLFVSKNRSARLLHKILCIIVLTFTLVFCDFVIVPASVSGPTSLSIINIPSNGAVDKIYISSISSYATASTSITNVGQTWNANFTITVKNSAGLTLGSQTVSGSGVWKQIGASSSMVTISATPNLTIDLSNQVGDVTVSKTAKVSQTGLNISSEAVVNGYIYYSDKPVISDTNLP